MSFVDSVKDIAGKFGESVERGAKTVSNSSKKFAEKTRIKREIARIETDINTDYLELGKAMFEKIADDPESEYAQTAADIKEKNEKLAELKAELDSLEDKMHCSSCGALISKEQLYCDKCGTKVSVDEVTVPDEDEAASDEIE